MIDKDQLKNEYLTIENIYTLVENLGGEPRPIHNNSFVSKTICHNGPGKGSYKLYYYHNTHGFFCYSDCGYMDIFELVRKVKTEETGEKWSLPKAIYFVAFFFGFSTQSFDFGSTQENLQDWQVLSNYERNQIVHEQQKQIVDLKIYDEKILKFLPHVRIPAWEQEGISDDVMRHRGIVYNPKSGGIVIPHYNINNQLIGIRERTTVKEIEEEYGKYRPAVINGQMYNHALSFNLYNLNNSKDNIAGMRKCIVMEGEKSCLKYASYFGEENDISVAACGSNLISYQVELLLSLGVEEIIVAFDRQYRECGYKDEEWAKWTKKLQIISAKYSPYVQVSFMFDKEHLLDYKDSPIDKGKDVFIELFNRRIIL